MARVMIVDDHRLFADSLKGMLEEAGIQVIAVANSGREAFTALENQDPDLILMDLGLPDVDGISAAQSIQHERPEIKIALLTARRDSKIMQEALAAGLNGYLTKDTDKDRFLTSLRAILGGDVVIQRGVVQNMRRGGTVEERDVELRIEQLTPREREVLEMLARGHSSEEMTDLLQVSPHTVRTHVHNVLTKLQVRSRLEAAAFAVRHDLVDDLRPDSRTPGYLRA